MCIIFNERNQSEKATYCMIPIIWHFGRETMQKTMFYRQSRRLVAARDPGRRARGPGWGTGEVRTAEMLRVRP